MASYNYEGNTYFFTFGKWVDSDNRPVKPDISAMLSKIFPEEEIRKTEKEQRAKKAMPKKQIKESVSTYVISKTAKVFAGKNNRNSHRKATEIPYYHRFELTEDQKRALALLESGNNVFLTGEAGTGKSFVLNEFLHRNRKKNIIVCAPTGIAAINVGGSTLHRTFNAPIGVAKPGEYNTNPSMAVVKADIVVIDEISMCRFDLFEYVIRTIRKAEEMRQNIEDADAFNQGRLPNLINPKQIIVVGDFYQLAPVISNKDREALFTFYDRESVGDGFAFKSPLWNELDFKSIVIKEIVRQVGDNDYIENLNKIRTGDKSGIEWFNNNISKEPISNGIYLCGTNQKADNINTRESEALPAKAVKYSAQVTGNVELSDKLTKDELSLKVGMQVMTLINDINEGFQNGSIGKIVALETDHVDVKLNNGRVVSVKPFNWEILGYEVQGDKVEKVVLGNFKQIPLKVAYAITIHKSQGQTYSSVNISPDCFAAGQLYVALSRAKTSKGMSFEHEIVRSSLRTSPEVKKFYDELTENNDTFVLREASEAEEKDDLDLPIEDEPESLLWEDDYMSHAEYDTKVRSSSYEKVMNMSEEEVNSCYMYRSIRDHHSAYAPWTVEEDNQLVKEMQQGLSNREIAQNHERTVGAIQSRIAKLNEVDNKAQKIENIKYIHENDNKTNVVIEKKKRGTKHDYWISPEDAARFEYEDLMLISRLKAKLNDLRDTNKSKRVTSKSILEYLINEGYMSEKYVDGVWVKIISEKGQSQGVRYIKCKNKLGFEYVIIGIPRQIQRMVVEYFTRI